MARSIKLNFLYNILLQLSKVIFPLITAPYISRVLDPDGVGIANFVNTYTWYFVVFAVLGIPTYGIREISKIRNDLKTSELFISQMITIECITTFIISIIYILSIFCINQLHSNAILFLIVGISLFITPFKIEWFFNGREEFGYITLRSIIIKAISVIAMFIVVKTKDDLLKYIIINLFATIANEIWNFIKLSKLGIHPKLCINGCKQHLKPIFTLFASSIAISIYTMLDTMMLGFLSSYAEVGYYSNSMHLIKMVLSVVTSLSVVMLPRVALYISSGETIKINELVSKSLGVVSLMAFPATIGLIMIAPKFVPLFFGIEFLGSILPMQVGAGLILAIGFNNLFCIQILTALGKDKLFLYCTLVGAISNFILNLILIPSYGAVGAAIASVCAELLVLLCGEIFVKKYTNVRIVNNIDILYSFIGSIMFIPICLIISKLLDGLLCVLISVIICVLTYIIIQYFVGNKCFESMFNTVKNMIGKH